MDKETAPTGAEAPQSPAVVKKTTSTIATPKKPAKPISGKPARETPETPPETTPAPVKQPEPQNQPAQKKGENPFEVFGWEL